MKKKVNIFGKSIPVLAIFVLSVALVSAALIASWGTITGNVVVTQGLTVDGEDWDTPIEYSESLTSLDTKQITSGHYLENTADMNAIVDLNTVCSELGSGGCVEITTTHDTVGLSTTVKGVAGADASAILVSNTVTLMAESDTPSGTEARIVINAEDVGITTLNDLNDMLWNVDVKSGYIAHVDVIIETGDGTDALVFEYANVNDIAGAYPIEDGLDTFGVRGIVDSNANAWLSSGCPGTNNIVLFTLGTWQSTNGESGEALACDGASTGNFYDIDGSTTVLRFEIEVDAWGQIPGATAESHISNIVINTESVEIATLTNPVTVNDGESLAFYVNSDFPKMMLPDTYTITTTVDAL